MVDMDKYKDLSVPTIEFESVAKNFLFYRFEIIEVL